MYESLFIKYVKNIPNSELFCKRKKRIEKFVSDVSKIQNAFINYRCYFGYYYIVSYAFVYMLLIKYKYLNALLLVLFSH